MSWVGDGDGLAVLTGFRRLLAASIRNARFRLRLGGQRNVDGHLVAVKVGVVGGTDERMQLESAAFDEHRLKRLDAQTVQRRRAVQQNRVVLDDRLEGVPDLGS